MRRIRPGIALFVLMSAIAAIASPSSSFSFGTIQSSCAPWDGPAVELRLTTEPTQCKQAREPFLSIAIWRGLPIQAGQVVKFGSGSDAGGASLCTKEGDCKRAESATIVFDKYEAGSSAAGHYELQFKGGEVLKGTFEVKWCTERVVCG